MKYRILEIPRWQYSPQYLPQRRICFLWVNFVRDGSRVIFDDLKNAQEYIEFSKTKYRVLTDTEQALRKMEKL